jgi:hypothetical protein
MREIVIVSRRGHEVGMELFDAITCLRSAGINPRRAVIGQACAIIWVDEREISISVDLLSNNGFEAAAVTDAEDR